MALDLDNVMLNIAVTGETGTGKSEFVNAIRGVHRGEEGWAPIGVIESTRQVNMYPHPNMPNVRIWDLPGIGTPDFKASTYMQRVGFQNYDFFIILYSTRLKENDVLLAKEITKQRKRFYFVCSKVDEVVRNEMKVNGRAEEGTLSCIRDGSLESLRNLGTTRPVFLITSHDLNKYDFQRLIDTLRADLDSERMDALMLSLPVYSKQCLDEKYSTFKNAIWTLAVVSGGIGAVPLPGISTACDAAIVLAFFTEVHHSFGLNNKALERLSERVNRPILEEVRRSELIQGIGRSVLKPSMLAKLAAAGGVEAVSCLIPVIGNIVAAGVSFVTTRNVLQEGLDDLYRVAVRVLEMAGLQ